MADEPVFLLSRALRRALRHRVEMRPLAIHPGPYVVPAPDHHAELALAVNDLCQSWLAQGALVTVNGIPQTQPAWPQVTLADWQDRLSGLPRQAA